MQSEYDLTVLRHLDPVGGRSAMDLAQRMPFGVPELVTRLRSLAWHGYVEPLRPAFGAPEDKDIPYVLTHKGVGAVGTMPEAEADVQKGGQAG